MLDCPKAIGAVNPSRANDRFPRLEARVNLPRRFLMIDSAIAVGPIAEALRPTISAVVTAIVGVAVTLGVALLKKWTGVTLQSAYVDSLRQAAQTEAGVLV